MADSSLNSTHCRKETTKTHFRTGPKWTLDQMNGFNGARQKPMGFPVVRASAIDPFAITRLCFGMRPWFGSILWLHILRFKRAPWSSIRGIRGRLTGPAPPLHHASGRFPRQVCQSRRQRFYEIPKDEQTTETRGPRCNVSSITRTMSTEFVEFRTKDHPEANGRTPQSGDQENRLVFPLEDGRFLSVRMGREGFERVSQFILDILADTPSYGDGSVPWDDAQK